MQCTGILVGNESPKDNRTMDQFIGSEQAGTPLGKLLIALTEEIAWSAKYTVYASFGGKPFLNIRHPIFLSDQSLMMYDNAKTVLSVRGVEDAIRTHIHESRKGIQSAINMLQDRMDNLSRVLKEIDWDKARAAVLTAFGLDVSKDLEPYHETPKDLYAFGKMESEHIFVARKIGNEFTGGVARLDLSYVQWHTMPDGVSLNERHGVFWAALAKAFAARTFDILEKYLRCERIFVFEKSWNLSHPDDYHVVEKIILRIEASYNAIVIRFGDDNLPESAFIQKESINST